MKKINLFFAIAILFILTSCSENYSNGERTGTINKLSKKGYLWDTWEGHLNLTQTGYTSSTEGFDFSLDNDKFDNNLVAVLDSASKEGWKVQLTYRQVGLMSNFFKTRGETDYFLEKIQVLDRNFTNHTSLPGSVQSSNYSGHIIDTVWVIIDKAEMVKHMQKK